MDPNHDSQDFQDFTYSAPKRSFWQKLGGGSLSISLILHVILLAAGLFWIFQIIPVPEKKVDFMPKSGGGGSPASVSQQKKQQMRISQPNMARVSAAGVTSSFVLPEPEDVTQMTSISGISSGSLAAGLGGHGSGGGKGDGNGTGVGNGLAPGLSDGTGNKNPFGMVSAERGALTGTFYDLKQDRNQKPNEMTVDKFHTELINIVRRGFTESSFSNFFKAPRQLFQTKVYIPRLSAEGAPAAFEVEKEVQPKMWIVTYRGAVQAPKTGKFRFVGAGDDILVVRFNNRPVFDFGYCVSGIGKDIFGMSAKMDGTTEDKELDKEVRRATPMKMPMTFYKYATTPDLNKNIGGLALGPEFSVEAGKTYPIDIMIGEIPGGWFSMALMIEEIGATYQKDSTGAPILPIFRLDATPPDPEMKGEAPPYAQDGPIWKFVPGAGKKDI
jgi:hypothetical protein